MTGRVTLRAVQDADLPLLYAQQADQPSYAMAATTPRDRAAFEAHWAKIRADPSTTLRAILYDGGLAGHLVSWSHDGEREVGYWVDRALWRRGIATRALRLFLEVEQARPLVATVAPHNAGSLRVLAATGFRPAGTVEGAAVELLRLALDER